jgi:DNA ligase-1
MQITPTLANDIDFTKARYPLMGFRKIDGVRASRFKDFLHGRSMDPFKNTAIVAKFSCPGYAGFDGEMTYNGWLHAGQVPEGESLCSLTTGLMNRSKLKKGEDALPDNAVWNLFDWLHPDVAHLTFVERNTELFKLVGTDDPNVHVLSWRWINDQAEAEEFIEECLQLGYEGAIFRDPGALHKSGRADKKTNDFWRHKPVSDKDAIVTGCYEAEENLNEAKTNSLGHTERSSHQKNKVGNGMLGGFFATDVATGKPIKVPAGAMKHDERIAVLAAWLEDPASVVGRPFKYTSLDFGTLDQPRQARWTSWRAVEDMSNG